MTRVSAVILAAGKADRAGGPKVVWPVDGIPSVRRVALATLEVETITETVVVTGAWAGEVKEALKGLKVKIVHNPDYASGQSTSLAAGLRAIDPDAELAIFLLADQPYITSQIIDDLVKLKGQATIAAPFFKQRRRNPVAFDLSRWRDILMNAKGDQGGRGLIDAHVSEVTFIHYGAKEELCFQDFDTLDDYKKMNSH